MRVSKDDKNSDGGGEDGKEVKDGVKDGRTARTTAGAMLRTVGRSSRGLMDRRRI